jgi:ketosteroid isomerase-like protein
MRVAMRATIAVCLGTLLAVLALAAVDESKPVADVDRHDAIAVAHKFRQALSRSDGDAALSTLAEDVLIFEHGGVERSRAEYASHHLAADMAFLAGLDTEVVDQRVFADDDLVILASEIRQHGTYKGAEVDRVTTETLVLANGANGWLIGHIHWSGD